MQRSTGPFDAASRAAALAHHDYFLAFAAAFAIAAILSIGSLRAARADARAIAASAVGCAEHLVARFRVRAAWCDLAEALALCVGIVVAVLMPEGPLRDGLLILSAGTVVASFLGIRLLGVAMRRRIHILEDHDQGGGS